jgi:hypothetical protein
MLDSYHKFRKLSLQVMEEEKEEEVLVEKGRLERKEL